MRFSDFERVDFRHFPRQWSMTPLDKEGHATSIQVEEVKFDTGLDVSVFTKRNLSRRR